MGLTKRSDLVIPELLTEAIKGQFAGKIALWGTGAAVQSFSLPVSVGGGKIKGGDTIKIPYFGTLGELDDVPEGDALTPTSISMTSETDTVIHSGKAIELSDWALLAAAYADPYAECARQFAEMVVRRADQLLLTAASASLPSGNINDVYNAGSPKNLDYDTLVDSKMLWKDEQADILLLTVHSVVFGNMLKLKDTTGRPLLTMGAAEGDLPRFCGIPVAVSDRNTVTTDSPAKYKSKILKRGALAWWAQESPVVKTDSDILADTEVAAIHVYHVAHRYQRTPGATRPGVIEIVTNG